MLQQKTQYKGFVIATSEPQSREVRNTHGIAGVFGHLRNPKGQVRNDVMFSMKEAYPVTQILLTPSFKLAIGPGTVFFSANSSK